MGTSSFQLGLQQFINTWMMASHETIQDIFIENDEGDHGTLSYLYSNCRCIIFIAPIYTGNSLFGARYGKAQAEMSRTSVRVSTELPR
jgi:hypothetical protein